MADWTVISDSQVDPDAPITSELGYAFRDNPIAIAEGAAGAPRIVHQALLNPTAGGTRTLTQNTSTAATTTAQSLFTISCLLPGSVRVWGNVTAQSGGGQLNVIRTRNGTDTSLATYSTTGAFSDDVSVQIGDKVSARITGGATGSITATSGLNLGNDSVGVVVL